MSFYTLRNLPLLLFLFYTLSFTQTDKAYNRQDFHYNHSKTRKYFIQFYDPYSDQTFYNSKDMEVDHIVPLKVAWDLEAHYWSHEQRKIFSNDPENLILVSKSCNRSKGSKALSEWLPKNQSFHSLYSNRYLHVINKYHLERVE